MSETTKLIGSAADRRNSKFYFLNAGVGDTTTTTAATTDAAVVQSGEVTASPSAFGWLGSLFGGRTDGYQQVVGEMPRKAPIKVEPKVFFANERTFLSWMHMSVTLASISVAIVAFAESNQWSQIYGLLLMPVAIAFCLYSLIMYIRRANMIRNREPGPYEDRFGPVVLACMLGSAIVVNFGVKLYDISN